MNAGNQPIADCQIRMPQHYNVINLINYILFLIFTNLEKEKLYVFDPVNQLE